MSLVENIVNQITTQGLGGVTSPIGFDLNDDTFSNILAKQMNNSANVQANNSVGAFGMPAGMFIEPIEGVEFSNTLQDQLEALGENKLVKEPISTEPFEMKELDFGNYYSRVLTSTDNNSDFINLAKRQASNAYGFFGKSYITDMTDFAQDIASMI